MSERWRIGRKPWYIVTDCDDGFSKDKDTGHLDKDFYGGNLVCESIYRPKDAYLISAAPELLECLQETVEEMKLQASSKIPQKWVDAIKKASGEQK